MRPTFNTATETTRTMEAILLLEDPYTILNIKTDATEEQITRAYKKLVLLHHPDKQNIENRALAEEVTKKINIARNQAVTWLTHPEEKALPTRENEHIDRVAIFTNRILNETIDRMFSSSDRSFLNLLNTPDAHAYGITMLWAHSMMTQQQIPTLKRIQRALANKTTSLDILNLAQGTRPYLANQNIMNHVKRRDHLEVLQTNSPMAQLHVIANENMGWNLEVSQCLQLAQMIVTTYPDTPLIMHNLAFKTDNHSFVGLYYQNNQYFIFNANHILFDENQESLRPLSWDEASKEITKTLYHTSDFLSQHSDINPTTISFFTLETQPLRLTKQASILYNQILQWINEEKFNIEHIFQSIYDGETVGILSQLYTTNPTLFSSEQLQTQLVKAIDYNHTAFALEICLLDTFHPELNWQYSRQYINSYVAKGHSLIALINIINKFKNAGINLISLLDEETKTNGSPWLDDIDIKIDRDHLINTQDDLRQVLAIGIKLTEKQRVLLICHLAKKLYAQKIENEKWLQVLVEYGYHFKIPDGLPDTSHLYYSLIQAGLSETAKKYVEADLINLNAQDENRLTTLNHFTKKHNWAEVRYLIDKGAPYSIGCDIEKNAIPPYAAWKKNITTLSDLYNESNRSTLLKLTSKEGDLLAMTASDDAIHIMEYALANGFDKKLRDNPIAYLYCATNPISVQRLIAALPKYYLNPQYQPIIGKPYTAATIMDLSTITSPSRSTKDILPIIIGVNKANMDEEITKLGIPTLTKISLNENTVYYSADNDLTKKICDYYLLDMLDQYERIIEALVFGSKNTAPDLGYCINQLSKLLEISQKYPHHASFYERIKSDYFWYKLLNEKFNSALFQNQLALLVEEGTSLIGLKITYDHDVAVAYTWINNIKMLGIETFLEDLAPNTKRNSDHLRESLTCLYGLKAILEETLGCVFTDIEPINDHFVNAFFLLRYDCLRKGLSPQKAFEPLDRNRFFYQEGQKSNDTKAQEFINKR